MIIVSDDFKQAMKQPVKELQASLVCKEDGVSISDENDLISFKVSGEGGLGKSVMRKLEAKYLGEHNLLGKKVTAGFGVKLPSGAFDFLNYGSFLVNELTISKDTGETSIVAYDNMINAMKPYVPLAVEYPIGLYDYTKALCEACWLELGNTSFEVHNDWQVTATTDNDGNVIDLWENIDGITYRDIFVQIAQATASVCMIGADDKVYFKPITSTGEQLTYDNMFKLKLEDQYGPINSVVLSRDPVEGEIVFLRDEASVETNGLTEFKISNNEIVDKKREDAITPIYNALHGVKYYPFEATTEGLGWYEIGDSFDIKTDTDDVFSTSLFNFSITVDGGIKETLKTVAETKTQAQYQYATSLAKRVKNTEILVNKQDGTIQSIVSDVYDENGVGPNEKYTKIVQDIGKVVTSVQASGGNNLIMDSVMFAYADAPDTSKWIVTGDGTIETQVDAESLSYGGVSGHSFTLNGKTVSQTIHVNSNTEGKTLYTFSTKIKKKDTGSCYVKIYNGDEENPETLLGEKSIPSGTGAHYIDYECKAMAPTTSSITIVFYGSADSDATFTDSMLAVGEYKSQWTQANGEVMNTQVVVDKDGLRVKSSEYDGYTVMSPKEFAGYYGEGTSKKQVFSLNKDVTEVEKLKARSEITMTPIKVVPITEGELQGWAFVPST